MVRTDSKPRSGIRKPKNHVNLLLWEGIGIANVSRHTVPDFFSRRSSAQNFSPAGLGQNFFVWGLTEKLFKRGEGSRSDEEKEAVNRSGMGVAMGVYPYVQ
jgi:hypothetical protein